MQQDEIGTKELNQFIAHLLHTLDASGGVGLAAPQVGVNMDLFITKLSTRAVERYTLCKSTPLQVWINPSYEVSDPTQLGGIETCLSVPGYFGNVSRVKGIAVSALTEDGKRVTETLVGWNARVFLHEVLKIRVKITLFPKTSLFVPLLRESQYDHLRGTLYIDKLTSDASGHGELYEKDVWKALEEKKRQEVDRQWLESRSLIVKDEAG